MVQQQPNDYSGVQETFSDVFELSINPWSAALTFGNRTTKPIQEANHFTVRMRMPLQQAKALAVLLLKNIRKYEEQTDTDIDLPQPILDELGIPREDWERFKDS